jgi:hypothetical protein
MLPNRASQGGEKHAQGKSHKGKKGKNKGLDREMRRKGGEPFFSPNNALRGYGKK